VAVKMAPLSVGTDVDVPQWANAAVKVSMTAAPVTVLRVAGRLPHHIGVGRTHAGTRVLVLVPHLAIRIFNAATGELISQQTPGPDQGTINPAAAQTKKL